jgi:hypothetical protein
MPAVKKTGAEKREMGAANRAKQRGCGNKAQRI